METRKLILLMVFSLSLVMLWDNYQVSVGKPPLFGLGTAQPVAQDKSSDQGKQAASDKPATDLPSAVSASEGNPAAQLKSVAAAPADEKGQIIVAKTDVMQLDFSTLGAQIVGSELLKQPDSQDKSKPMQLFSNTASNTYLGQVGVVGVADAPNHRSLFQFEGGPTTLGPNQDSLDLKFKASSGGVNVEYTYTLYKDRYDIGFKATVTNTTQAVVDPSVYMQITRDGNPLPDASKFYHTFTGPAIYSPEGKYQKIKFSNIDDNSASFVKSAESGWVAMVQHYFVSAIIPEKGSRQYYTLLIKPNLYAVGMKSAIGAIQPGQSATYNATLYSGPQNQRALAKLSEGLDLVVDYGWLTVIAKPIHWLLDHIHGIVHNWGWSIIILTCLIKLLFFPLSATSYKSMAKMRQVGPRMQKLKEQYGDDKAGFQRAMMEMYKREKINPLGGCMPIVVQIPVFISLYWVLLASVEMRGAPWLGWVSDLAQPDPYYILPIIMAITMFVQTRLNPTPPDPVQAKLMMVMPLVFSFMFLFFPSGLVLYWVVNNMLSITQQWVITRKLMKS
ncbi:MAG TPA: membrane protein insertase YidC [Limnobacter sp.]|uniref:membrane protein insertase YidC n=1 Tax=Limnobacter sp. TaxID=2003368 RepID=UPI002E37D088|nr:membrane protein insertase YidC [Limnobacter sp.]HEX5485482.1 membrane protein insertase YidC [Limnobacter sp.]